MAVRQTAEGAAGPLRITGLSPPDSSPVAAPSQLPTAPPSPTPQHRTWGNQFTLEVRTIRLQKMGTFRSQLTPPMDARIKSGHDEGRCWRFPHPSWPDLIRPSMRPLRLRGGGLGGWRRQWMPGSSPLLSGLDFRRGSAPMTENISAPVVTPAGAQRRAGAQACPGRSAAESRGPGKPGESGACGPGPRIKSGVTSGGTRTAVRASRDPSPDPADAPIYRPYQGLAPHPAILNRTAVDRVRA